MARIWLPILLLTGALSTPARADIVTDRVNAIFRSVDVDRDGRATLEEWIQAGRKERGFMRADANADGVVTRDELLLAARARLADREGRRQPSGRTSIPPPSPLPAGPIASSSEGTV